MIKVLLIDDSASSRLFLTTNLPNLIEDQLEITECESALKALQALLEMGEDKPDLIITDLKMPEMSGEELLRSLKAHPYYKHTNIVILSGTLSPKLTAELKSKGALTVIPKPPSEQDLAKVLHFIKKKISN